MQLSQTKTAQGVAGANRRRAMLKQGKRSGLATWPLLLIFLRAVASIEVPLDRKSVTDTLRNGSALKADMFHVRRVKACDLCTSENETSIWQRERKKERERVISICRVCISLVMLLNFLCFFSHNCHMAGHIVTSLN